MDEVEGPAAVLVASREHHVDGFAHAAVGLDFRVAQIVQSAQNVIVPRRRIRKTQPTFINYFSGAQRAEQASLEQIFFATLASLGERNGFAAGAFVCQQPFEHVDRGVKR